VFIAHDAAVSLLVPKQHQVRRAMNNIVKGLEGLEVDDTAICLVDGTAGQLSYRGQLIETLVERPFVDVVGLVVGDHTETLADELRTAGALTEQDATLLRDAEASGAHPMHILMGLTPLLSVGVGGTTGFERFGDAAPGFRAAAKLPALIAGLLRLRTGRPTIDYPIDEPSFNTRFLIQAGTAAPSDLLHRAFEVTQILQIEHSFNAGTFAARVIASTLADVQNSLAGGFAALHGPLHGGADQAALAMADEVGDPAAAAPFVDRCLTEGRKIMGMGHREYKVLDPRARFVKELAADLSRGTSLEATYLILEAIEARFRERMLEKGKSLYANLEFYKGVVYRAVGLPADFFTATFAMARVFGYLAHFIESRVDNRLIRPAARYVGVMP
jgi:citrate synthase